MLLADQHYTILDVGLFLYNALYLASLTGQVLQIPSQFTELNKAMYDVQNKTEGIVLK